MVDASDRSRWVEVVTRRITTDEHGDPREWWGLPRRLSLDPKHRWRLSFDDENHDDEFNMPPRYSEVRDAREAAPDAWTRLWLLLDGWDSMLVAEWPPLASSDPEGESDG